MGTVIRSTEKLDIDKIIKMFLFYWITIKKRRVFICLILKENTVDRNIVPDIK